MPTSSFATTSVTKVRHAPVTKPDATKMPAAGMAYRAQRTSTHRAIVTPPVHSQEVKSGKRRLGPSPSQQESPPKPPPAVGRLKRPTQEAHATVTHLRGAAAAIGYATPRTARGAAALAAKAKLKMRARFIEESAGPRPASAHQPIRPKPFATNTPRPATAPSPHFSRKHLPSPRVAAGLPSRRKFRPPIEKGQVQPAAAMPHYSSGVPPGGASSLDVLHPEPISPLSPHRFTKMARHVQSAARVDHEPIAFGDVGKAAVKRQQTGRRSASPPKITSPRPSMRRQSSNLDLLNKQPARAAVKPRDSCPFDVSYAKSPFLRGPPTARGPVRMKPRPGGPVGLSERPF